MPVIKQLLRSPRGRRLLFKALTDQRLRTALKDRRVRKALTNKYVRRFVYRRLERGLANGR